MAGRGRIREADITLVREQADIEAVVSAHVTLKRSGTALKGLCPFHDEKGASFHVTPARNRWHCFGCSEGGDVIAFVQKIDHITFVEAIERLADQCGITLTYEDADPGYDAAARAAERSQRTRLIAAHVAAQALYAEALLGPAAAPGRQFLTVRGFDRSAAATFGVGFAPDSWDALTNHLLSQGFTAAEIITAGLASESKRGTPVDRFRGRLMWPIRDTNGDIVGFGARKLLDTDDGPKFLNTPETPIYKKSKVLFGLDLARKAIAAKRQVVVVEGYGDVMACHLAGITTAIATCGTAFGEEHTRIVRRLVGDAEGAGEVIYCFDGDSAGQKAALKAYELDHAFQTRTYVAVEPHGMDPCDLRLAEGDEAVVDLINSRVPLFEFAIRSILGRHDLGTAEGRVNALGAAAQVIAQIRDAALRPEYERRLGRWLSLPAEDVAAAVRRATTHTTSGARTGASAGAGLPGASEAPAAAGATLATTPQAQALPHPDPTEPVLRTERETLRLLITAPVTASAWVASVSAEDYAHPAYRALFTAVSTALSAAAAHHGAPAALDTTTWLTSIESAATDPTVRSLVNELTVEPAQRYQVNKWLPAVSTDEDDLARRAFLNVAVRGTARRLAQVTAALSDPSLSANETIARASEMLLLTARKKDLTTQADTLPGLK